MSQRLRIFSEPCLRAIKYFEGFQMKLWPSALLKNQRSQRLRIFSEPCLRAIKYFEGFQIKLWPSIRSFKKSDVSKTSDFARLK